MARRSPVAGAILLAIVLESTATPIAQTPASIPTPLGFDQALDIASSRNLAVAAARRARAIREAGVRTAGLRPNPDVSLEISGDTPHEVFGVALPVELGGTRGRRIDVAREELTLADVDLQTELRNVRRDLRKAFYSLVAADEGVRLSRSVLDITQQFREAAQGRFDAGAAPRLEVLQADLGVARAETDLAVAEATRIAAQATLNGVIDSAPQQPLVLSGALADRRSVITYEAALAMATTSNIDLVSLDRQIAIEERRVSLLRAERTPTPIFSLSGLFGSPDFTSTASVGISLTVPLFNRNQGEIAQSVATTAQLRTRRDATRRVIESEVFGTLAKIDAQRRQVEAYEQRLVPTATNLETLAEESYRAGRTSVLGVLDAQRNLRDLSREALQAALDLQLSLADLEDLLGSPLP